jgi:hypothetical protein
LRAGGVNGFRRAVEQFRRWNEERRHLLEIEFVVTAG